MSREDFISKYNAIAERALSFAEKAEREGLLSLEDFLDKEKINNRDIFEYGMLLVIDGTDYDLIELIIDNIIEQEKDANIRKLKTIQKAAVLGMQTGTNSRLQYFTLNSFTDLPLNEDAQNKKFGPC